MWEIYEHRKIAKLLKFLPIDILKRYEKWKDIIIISGPKGLRLIKGFQDESLKGKLKGNRSSRLGKKYHIIYKVIESRVLVQVVDLTPHDYRKK